MSQIEKATSFARLHVKGAPVLLYNAWDAGSARAIVEAGGKAIATSSWAVAAAHGYADGEKLPVALAQQIVGRVAASVDVPVTVDIEGGYSDSEVGLAETVARFLELGVAGGEFRGPRGAGRRAPPHRSKGPAHRRRPRRGHEGRGAAVPQRKNGSVPGARHAEPG